MMRAGQKIRINSREQSARALFLDDSFIQSPQYNFSNNSSGMLILNYSLYSATALVVSLYHASHLRIIR